MNSPSTNDIVARIYGIIDDHWICDCWDSKNIAESLEHVATQIVAELGLHRENYRPVHCLPHKDSYRIVSSWMPHNE